MERLLTNAEITATEQHETALQMSWLSALVTRLLTESLYLECEQFALSYFHRLMNYIILPLSKCGQNDNQTDSRGVKNNAGNGFEIL